MKSMRKRGATRQAGFTLVELVIVITILGVLAAVALPRFTGLQSDARAAKAESIFGSMRAAAAQVKAVAIVKGKACNSSYASGSSGVALEGKAIALANCYPTHAEADGIIAALGISATSDKVTFSADTTTKTMTVTMADARDGLACNVTYTEAAADGEPVIARVTSGC